MIKLPLLLPLATAALVAQQATAPPKLPNAPAVGVEKDGALYGLNLKDSKIRRAVYESPADTDSIKKLYAKHGEKYTSIPADLG